MRRLFLALSLIAVLPGAALAAADKALLHAREGVAALLRGQYEKAIVAYNEALKSENLSDSRRANILNDRGVAQWRMKFPKRAIADFNKAIELFPDYAVVYNNRGNALLDLSRPDEAIKDFERAIALAPAYGAAHNNRGNALLGMERYDEAIAAFHKAVDHMSTNAVPFNGRGRAQRALKRPYAAIRDYSKALTLNAKYASALRNRGTSYLSIGRYADSVRDLSQAILFAANDPELRLARADAHVKSKKYKAALEDLEKAIELDQAPVEAFIRRGVVLTELKRYVQAEADFKAAISLNPRSARVFVERAALYLALGRSDDALLDANKALAFEPEDAAGLEVRGQIYEGLGQTQDALNDYREALRLDGERTKARAAIEKLTGEATPVETTGVPVGASVAGWVVTRAKEGGYVATNPKWKKVRVTLEMYGEGEPEILEWQLLKNALKGVGLLRYFAGTSKAMDGARLEYVALVDLWQGRAVAIEPHSWGANKANWAWQQVAVVVTDPQGVASEIKLRKARPQPAYSQRDPNAPWFDDSWWRGRPSASARQRARQRARQQRERRSGGGVFNWLFGN